MGAPLSLGGLIKSRAGREGLVANPYTRQLLGRGQIPANFLGVNFMIAVVVPIAGEAGPSHAMEFMSAAVSIVVSVSVVPQLGHLVINLKF